MSSSVLEIDQVTKSFFPKRRDPVHVLKGVDLTIQEGEMVALIAPSGSGKSTLLNIVGLLDKPTSGDVIFGGQRLMKASDKVKTKTRSEDIGFIYQFHHLIDELSCLENIMLPLQSQNVCEKFSADRARKLLALVGLEDRAQNRPGEISGGQQQRVAICRALANSPKLLLADEPTGNLDPDTSSQIFRMFRQIIEKTGLSTLIVTHDLDMARKMDRVLKLENGVVVEI